MEDKEVGSTMMPPRQLGDVSTNTSLVFERNVADVEPFRGVSFSRNARR